jgi:predicted branched-subunit amino acid permease
LPKSFPPFCSAAFLGGAREALGVPAAAVAAGFIGFGALASASGASIWFVAVSTVAIWALPGQLVLVDMWQIGAPMIAVMLAVMLTNARFLPMTLTLIPLLRDRSHPQRRYYFAAHLIAMTSWAVCMRRFPAMPRPERLVYLAGFTLTCMAVSMVAVVTGYLIAGSIPAPIQLGLLFLTPVYFCVLLIGEAQSRLAAIALACGGLAGPLFYLLSPQWSVLLAGFAGGSAAFAIHKALRRSRA